MLNKRVLSGFEILAAKSITKQSALHIYWVFEYITFIFKLKTPCYVSVI